MNNESTIGGVVPASSQVVSYTGVSASSARIETRFTFVRLASTTDCFINITNSGAAAVANTCMFLPAGGREYFPLPQAYSGPTNGPIVTVIQATAAGNLYITPCQ